MTLLSQQPRKVCRACGQGNLIWGHGTPLSIFADKFLLYNEDGTLHDCPVNPLTPYEGSEKDSEKDWLDWLRKSDVYKSDVYRNYTYRKNSDEEDHYYNDEEW